MKITCPNGLKLQLILHGPSRTIHKRSGLLDIIFILLWKKKGPQHYMVQHRFNKLHPRKSLNRNYVGFDEISQGTNSCDVLLWTPTTGCANVGQLSRTYISSVQTGDVVWKICPGQWMIWTVEERKFEKSEQAARLDDDAKHPSWFRNQDH